ncbi:protein C19orf12 homolog [Anopheles nili]|uniref:protein C19orf12 homolog n=1 Tax=Anopheles nili TaxID=185578 RepID=UPI00237AE5A8|nr:protein C19orf12 homolog [Anopheles nili]
MPIRAQELFEAVAILTDKQSMRVTLKGSLKGAAFAGTTTFIGGIMAGSIGLLIGGVIGGILSYAWTNDELKPVSQIILHDLTIMEQELLKDRIIAALTEFQATDIIMIVSLLNGNNIAQKAVLSSVATFVTNQLHMKIID